MSVIADLHIHSRLSRATSHDMTIPKIAQYARLKGIGLVATGDFTHPDWLAELRRHLVPTGNGLFTHEGVQFVLNVEVNNTAIVRGRLRRIHNLVFASSFDDAQRISDELAPYGNLKSDGRPTLTVTTRDMLLRIRDAAADAFLVPSHIWTPWFSLFGANSGFDSVEECFGDLAGEIFAVETGLSSDPAMNWRLSALDRFALISNSDAHSPSRLGREANVFDRIDSYADLRDVLRTRDPARFLSTIEFYPEEGKYHYDGHRRCNVRLAPHESILNSDLCPVCGRRLTVGVLHRVEELADRKPGARPPRAIPYRNLVPLEEIIAEAINVGRDSVAVSNLYRKLVAELGSEFGVLIETPLDEITRVGGERIAEGVRRVRSGELTVLPGYDGVFGTVRVFGAEPAAHEPDQMSLF